MALFTPGLFNSCVIPGLHPNKGQQSLTIGKCDYDTAGVLNLAVGDPVVEVRRVLCDRQDRVIYLADVTYRSDFVRLEMDLLA